MFILPIMCLPHNVPPAEANNVCPIEPFSILIYVHVIYWVFHLVGDQILKHAHKSKRLQGYTEFYLETVRLPTIYRVTHFKKRDFKTLLSINYKHGNSGY